MTAPTTETQAAQWKLVPVEPTDEMTCAIMDPEDCATPDAAARVWAAMLSAVPETRAAQSATPQRLTTADENAHMVETFAAYRDQFSEGYQLENGPAMRGAFKAGYMAARVRSDPALQSAQTTETKITPGPWMANGKFIYAQGSVDTYSGAVVGCIASCEETQQSDEEGRTWSTGGDVIANARLIAAAPDLLDALKAMVSEFDADEFGSEGQMRVCLQASQAIAKAVQS